MPLLRCYVDDRTLAILQEYGERNGRSVEDLAEAAISDAAIRSLPPPARGPRPCDSCTGVEGGHTFGCIRS